jgi:hypothetical protein
MYVHAVFLDLAIGLRVSSIARSSGEVAAKAFAAGGRKGVRVTQGEGGGLYKENNKLND